MLIKVEWPTEEIGLVKRKFDFSSGFDRTNLTEWVFPEILKLSKKYDVIIDNGVVTFVEKS